MTPAYAPSYRAPRYYNNTMTGTSAAYTIAPWATNGTTASQITMTGNYYFDDAYYVYNAAPPRTPRYRPPPRAFNRYVNGSDLLEEFIAFAGREGVRQGEVLRLPVELFVKWLVIRAFEADNEEPPADVELTLAMPLPTPKVGNLRCTACGRFVSARNGVELCDEACAAKHFARRRNAA